MDLTGRCAFITGGGRGLGRSMALVLAKAGADVTVLSRTGAEVAETAQLVRETGRRGIAIACDITDQEAVTEAVDRATAEMGKIDILINNAGMAQRKSALDITPEDWQRMVNLHLNGTFYVTQAVGRKMVEQKYGKIIVISSAHGVRGGSGTNLHYSTTKGGLLAFTRALAVEWARYNINVNCIAPGAIYTSMTRHIQEDKELEARYLRLIPLRRIAQPEEFNALVLYLSSSASDYMTGDVIVVDGGVHEKW